jgi:hypothetical protein
LPPLRGCDAKQGDIQQIGLGCVNGASLLLGKARRNQPIPDGIGMAFVVDLGQDALEISLQRQRA